MSLAGKKALIMGGSKGLGLACAQAFAQRGCDLHLLARDGAAFITGQSLVVDGGQTT